MAWTSSLRETCGATELGVAFWPRRMRSAVVLLIDEIVLLGFGVHGIVSWSMDMSRCSVLDSIYLLQFGVRN